MKNLSIFSTIIFLFILSGCGGNADSPMRSAYVADCMEEFPNEEACGCLFDYGSERLTEEEMLNSDLTFDFRNSNNISSPPISSESQSRIAGVVIEGMGACI
jgi:hypothetical protein